MHSTDATPPADFPRLVVVMDAELVDSHPSSVFTLRIALESGGVDIVSLPGAVTPVGARKLAIEMGYEPTHWIKVGEVGLTRFY